MSQRRVERACKRIADANVPFDEKGTAADKANPYLCQKIR